MSDPSTRGDWARRSISLRCFAAAAIAGGLLLVLSGVSDAKPPTLEDVWKRRRGPKPVVRPTPRPIKPVVRPNPRPIKPVVHPIPRPQPAPTAAAKATVALVEITSTPAGARIYLDGVDTGKVTPTVLEADLGAVPRRTAEVELRAAGKLAKKERVVLQAGRRSEVQISLDEEFTPGRVARVQLGGETVELMGIPGGEFMMGALATDSEAEGDEKPAHRVRLSGFEMGVTEVTVGQFLAHCRATGKELPKQQDWNNTAQHPVHNVNWDDAVGFCAWATSELKRQGLPGSVRLPTEAEWEYAARGGATGIDGRPLYKYPWGDQASAGGDGLVNFTGNGDGYQYTAPVGRFKPNGYGLRDMAGNLWEWCQDRYDEGYYAKSPVENPQRSKDLGKRLLVLRGGSWGDHPLNLRASNRNRDEPDPRHFGYGFRLARTTRP